MPTIETPDKCVVCDTIIPDERSVGIPFSPSGLCDGCMRDLYPDDARSCFPAAQLDSVGNYKGGDLDVPF